MREIRTCVQPNPACQVGGGHCDACHSGALTATKSAGGDAAALNAFMESLQSSKKSLAWLTSSQANQVSFEDDDLANGVFTHYLMRGLEGDAYGYLDGQKDGWVTIQELFR